MPLTVRAVFNPNAPACLRIAPFVVAALAVAVPLGSSWAAPVITSTNVSSAARSGRVILRGSDLGEMGGGHRVEVAGLPAHTARWSQNAISVYIPEAAGVGPSTIRVIKVDGSFAEFPINVTARAVPAAGSKVLWKFETDGPAIRHRGSVWGGEEGTVYFSDTRGFLYAVSAQGALRWIYCASCVNSTGGEGPVSLGGDGTVYVGGNPVGPDTHIHAVNPNGSRKWLYTDTWTDTVAGPSVGPDGDVYLVTETAGRGLTRLDAATGEIVWATQATGRPFDERGQYGADLAFGPATSGGADKSRVYTVLDMRPWQTPVPSGNLGTVFSYETSGSLAWERGTGGHSIAGGQMQGEPAVGPDGTVYAVHLLPPNAWALYAYRPEDGTPRWNLYLPPGNVMTEPTVTPSGDVLVVRNTVHIHAVRPNGTVRWTYTDPAGSLYEAPTASPDGRVVISSGSTGDTLSFTGHIRAVTSAGQPLFTVNLPRELGGTGTNGTTPIIPSTRAFYSPDSRVAYVGTSGGGVESEEHAYLLALDIAPPAPTCVADIGSAGGTPGADGQLSNNDFIVFINWFFAGDARADRGAAGGQAGADGRLDNNDFIAFINQFFAGC